MGSPRAVPVPWHSKQPRASGRLRSTISSALCDQLPRAAWLALPAPPESRACLKQRQQQQQAQASRKQKLRKVGARLLGRAVGRRDGGSAPVVVRGLSKERRLERLSRPGTSVLHIPWAAHNATHQCRWSKRR